MIEVYLISKIEGIFKEGTGVQELRMVIVLVKLELMYDLGENVTTTVSNF